MKCFFDLENEFVFELIGTCLGLGTKGLGPGLYNREDTYIIFLQRRVECLIAMFLRLFDRTAIRC